MFRPIPAICDFKGCSNAPTKKISLSLPVNANHEPAISISLVYFCNEHADFISINDNWSKICRDFEIRGHVAKKEFGKLLIESI